MAISICFYCKWQSHLPIKCPSGGQEAMKQYYNFKNFYSVVLLGLVDANYRFIWASLRAPETLMTLPISKVHPFGMILQVEKLCPDK